jgi:uncharacterized protein DUF5666
MTEPSPSFEKSIGHADRRRVVAVAVASVALIVTAAVAMAASPGPSTTGAAPSASNAPAGSAKPHAEGSAKPDHSGFRFKLGGGFGPFAFGGPEGAVGRGGVEITAIDGSNVSLKTVDGWTRTIQVTSSTEITKGGAAITLNDLAVGDMIRFRQKKNNDGSFTVTHVDVVLPTVAGKVTAKTSSTITIQQRDGTSVTVHVGASTKFRVQGANGDASLSDVTVGMGLIADGEKNADGSLNASRVVAGNAGKLHAGKGPEGGPNQDWGASPAPSGNPG